MRGVTIRPATPADVGALYGRPQRRTVRALAFLRDGRVDAVVGLTADGGPPVAFADLRDGLTAPKLTVWRCALVALAFLARHRRDFYAMAATPESGRFLERLGFTYSHEQQEGTVYQWHS